MMRAFQQYSVTALWLAWLAYWSVAAIGAKATRRREGIASRLSHIVPLTLGIVLLSMRHAPVAWLGIHDAADQQAGAGVGARSVA